MLIPRRCRSRWGTAIQITYDLYGQLFQDDEADKRRSERAERLANLLG